jgi:hypothetical protein
VGKQEWLQLLLTRVSSSEAQLSLINRSDYFAVVSADYFSVSEFEAQYAEAYATSSKPIVIQTLCLNTPHPLKPRYVVLSPMHGISFILSIKDFLGSSFSKVQEFRIKEKYTSVGFYSSPHDAVKAASYGRTDTSLRLSSNWLRIR